MVDVKEISQRLLDAKSGADAQDVFSDIAKGAARKTTRGLLRVMASGFGKGLLLAAALVVGAMAFSSGIFAVNAGYLFSEGALAGIGQAAAFLFNGVAGPIMLGLGATLGAALEVKGNQDKIRADVIRLEAKAYEATRLHKQAIAVQEQPSPDQDGQDKNKETEPFHAAREMERRRRNLQLVKS